jgi:ketosteroid isomerase-like protein
MTTSLDGFELSSDVDGHSALYVRAFNSGDFDAVDRLYTEKAISVWEPGRPLTGAARRAELAEFLQGKPTMTATVAEKYETTDTALLVVDWTITYTDEAGALVKLEGRGLDVLRRGPDGNWRHDIDDPFGGVRP